MMKFFKNSSLLNVIFYMIQSLTILGIIISKKFIYVSDASFSFLAYTAILILEKKGLIQFKNSIRILLILTIFFHNLAGELIGLYDNPISMLYFDKALHVFGTFSFSLFAFSVVNCKERFQLNSGFQYFIFVFLLGMSLGAIFEIVEFILDVVLKVKNQRDLIDTDLDMIFDLVGSVFAGLLSGWKKSEILKNP